MGIVFCNSKITFYSIINLLLITGENKSSVWPTALPIKAFSSFHSFPYDYNWFSFLAIKDFSFIMNERNDKNEKGYFVI